jgi:hypothetical protein
VPSVVISNMPEQLHRRLMQAAEKNGVSMDQQALKILEGALRSVPPLELPTPIEPLRPVTPEEIAAAIREGRECNSFPSPLYAGERAG